MLGNLRSCCGCCVYWTASNLRINSFSSRPSLVRLYGNSTVNGCFEGTKEEQKQKQKGEAAPKDGAKAASTKPITVPILRQMKAQGTPVAALTAYDYMMAAQLEPAGIDVVLVGDSLGNVMQGHATTLPVKLEDMIYHTQLVSRALKKALLISDMPFSCMQSVETVVSAAVRLLTEAGAAMVKLEMSPEGGGQLHLSMVRALAERQVPVCVHLGLTPQSVHALGGFRVQGTEKASRSAQLLIDQALAAEQAGASMLLLECVPTGLAKQITERVGVPTIGIGAGVHCDIQLLILHDMLGLSSGQKPAKFVKNFLRGRDSIREAFAAYVSEVRTREFPAEEHSYH